jgi:uncharacterized protein YdbL (DUF1318 family)
MKVRNSMLFRTFSTFVVAGALLGATPAFAQDDLAGSLRASGQAGEQTDGYMGVVAASGDVQARVDQVNIKRKAYYTDLAGKRGVAVSDVAESTACMLLSTKVLPGQYYRTEAGAWVKRGDAAVPLPARCTP